MQIITTNKCHDWRGSQGKIMECGILSQLRHTQGGGHGLRNSFNESRHLARISNSEARTASEFKIHAGHR